MKLREFGRNKRSLYFIISFLSVLVFIGIYGTHIINPLYTSWLFDGGELSQHYLGWVAYRKSAWHFPIGMVDNLAYPNQTSVIFTDSIPLFAVIFKLISPILPNEFQYLGLWGVMCFVLQTIFTARILEQHTQNKWIIIPCSLMSLMSPIVFFRMYGHTALASHWIIIYGLGLLFCYKHDNHIFYQTALLAFFASTVHMYIVLMCGIIVIGICLADSFVSKKPIRGLGIIAVYISVSTFIVWLLGGFSTEMDAREAGLGIFSFNLNGFFNPQGWSCILKDPPCYEGQHEGFAYLGAGFIILLIISLFIMLISRSVRIFIKDNWKISLPLFCVFILSLIVALSPVVTFGHKILFQLHLPTFVTDIWSIFRASGRISWIDVYIIEITVFIILIRFTSKEQLLTLALCASLVLQFYDLHVKLSERYALLGPVTEYPICLDTKDFWNTLADKKEIKHVIYYNVPERSAMYRITEWAINNGMTVSNYYFPRSLDEKIATARDVALASLPVDSIFIFPVEDKISCIKYPLHYYRIDNLIIGYANAIPGFNEMNDSEFEMDWFFSDNQFLFPESGNDTDSGRKIYPGGFSFGPYWTIPDGNYQIAITGDNLPKETEVILQSDKGTTLHNFTITEQTPQTIVVEVALETNISDLEIVIRNNSNENILVNFIHLKAIK